MVKHKITQIVYPHQKNLKIEKMKLKNEIKKMKLKKQSCKKFTNSNTSIGVTSVVDFEGAETFAEFGTNIFENKRIGK